MLWLYRSILYLYPAAYRGEYGEEMLGVLCEVQAETRKKSRPARVRCTLREALGLLYGALKEHLHSSTGPYDRARFSSMFLGGRFAMRSEFRFPKATVGLMLVILAAVMFAIEKAQAISASIPHGNPSVGHIHRSEITILPLLLAMISAIGAGVIGWAILFALRRSGIQQLSEMNPSSGQRSSK